MAYADMFKGRKNIYSESNKLKAYNHSKGDYMNALNELSFIIDQKISLAKTRY
jgi:hypothetical protein